MGDPSEVGQHHRTVMNLQLQALGLLDDFALNNLVAASKFGKELY